MKLLVMVAIIIVAYLVYEEYAFRKWKRELREMDKRYYKMIAEKEEEYRKDWEKSHGMRKTMKVKYFPRADYNPELTVTEFVEVS